MKKTKLINYRTLHKSPSDTKILYADIIPIDRRSIFGNPFKIDKDNTREDVISAYKEWFYEQITHSAKFQDAVDELKGKTLGCWCRPQEGFKGRLLCHGQIIIAYLEGCKPEEVE